MSPQDRREAKKSKPSAPARKENQNLKSPKIAGTMPHQINAPVFPEETRKYEAPFVNKYGVVIGDSHYESENSPLEQWSTETDPAIMAGDEWVHPTNDIGWNTAENRELIEQHKGEQQKQKDARFMHPTIDSSYNTD